MWYRHSPLALALLGLSSSASASTPVSGTIATNTTWTLSGSPYVLTGDVLVKAGATLTIEPGVVVKLNQASRQLTIQGQLYAVGTPDQRIVFTSIKDDRFGGDTGGDGPTVGAPGQWYALRLAGPASTLSHVDVYFGGWGSSNTAYGAITITSAANHVISNAFINSSQRSGIYSNNGSSTVSHSTLSQNAIGVSLMNSAMQVSDSSISSNATFGVTITSTVAYVGSAPTLTNNTIAYNGQYGVRLVVESASLPNVLPIGDANNIVGNDALAAKPKQLYSVYNIPLSNWSNNYWAKSVNGTLVGVAEQSCAYAPTGWSTDHLAYVDQQGSPTADGPINAKLFSQTISGTTYSCMSDYVTSRPASLLPF
jgi:hypothetical protein